MFCTRLQIQYSTRVLPSVVLMGKKETLSTYLKAPTLTLPAGHYQSQKFKKNLIPN